MVEWEWASFAQLSTRKLYEILLLRSEVFVLEQNCVYQDIDGLDPGSFHLLGWQPGQHGQEPQLVAYLRCLPKGLKFAEASLGRVITRGNVRGSGAGRALLTEALAHMQAQWGDQVIRIAAQLYLQKFYEGFGFVACSAPFEEDGIPHIDMLRQASPPRPSAPP